MCCSRAPSRLDQLKARLRQRAQKERIYFRQWGRTPRRLHPARRRSDQGGGFCRIAVQPRLAGKARPGAAFCRRLRLTVIFSWKVTLICAAASTVASTQFRIETPLRTFCISWRLRRSHIRRQSSRHRGSPTRPSLLMMKLKYNYPACRFDGSLGKTDRPIDGFGVTDDRWAS